MNFYIIVEKNTNICKIGVSNDIEERLKTLQTGNSSKLLLNSGFYCKIPYKLETIVKNKYKESNRIGEWYDIENKAGLIEYIRCKAHDLNNKYYTCNLCDFKTLYKTGYKRHLKTDKHDKKEKLYINNDKVKDFIKIIHGEKDLLFECNRCHRSFNRTYNLERHENKKKQCEEIEPNATPKIGLFVPQNPIEPTITQFKCNHCNRIFTRNWHLIRHLKTCKIKKKEEEEQEKLRIIEIKAELLKLENKHKSNTITNNITNNNNSTSTNSHNIVNINNNIILNDYGKENIDFLKNEKYKSIITGILQNGFNGIQNYISYKYCNPDQPENMTIKYTNNRSNKLKIRENNKWKTRNKNEVLNELYNRDKNVEEVLNVYEDIYELEEAEQMDKIQVSFLNIVETVYDDDEDEQKSMLDKAKNATLDDLYNCYSENKDIYK